MQRNNCRRPLNFSTEFISAELIKNVRDLPLPGRTIIFNIGDEDIEISDIPPQTVRPFTSTTIVDAVIKTAKAVVAICVRELGDGRIGAGNLGWARYAETIADPSADVLSLALYRSPQDELTEVRLNRGAARMVGHPEATGVVFAAKANLWFAPQSTDCLIHNRHPFIETHVQLMGRGRMQKFRTQRREALYEEIVMAPGMTQPFFDCISDSAGGFLYPWHQYYADTDCIWLAFELHPLKTRETIVLDLAEV